MWSGFTPAYDGGTLDLRWDAIGMKPTHFVAIQKIEKIEQDLPFMNIDGSPKLEKSDSNLLNQTTQPMPSQSTVHVEDNDDEFDDEFEEAMKNVENCDYNVESQNIVGETNDKIESDTHSSEGECVESGPKTIVSPLFSRLDKAKVHQFSPFRTIIQYGTNNEQKLIYEEVFLQFEKFKKIVFLRYNFVSTLVKQKSNVEEA